MSPGAPKLTTRCPRYPCGGRQPALVCEESVTGNYNYLSVQWGVAGLGDVPMPGDYDGDGRTDPHSTAQARASGSFCARSRQLHDVDPRAVGHGRATCRFARGSRLESRGASVARSDHRAQLAASILTPWNPAAPAGRLHRRSEVSIRHRLPASSQSCTAGPDLRRHPRDSGSALSITRRADLPLSRGASGVSAGACIGARRPCGQIHKRRFYASQFRTSGPGRRTAACERAALAAQGAKPPGTTRQRPRRRRGKSSASTRPPLPEFEALPGIGPQSSPHASSNTARKTGPFREDRGPDERPGSRRENFLKLSHS